MTQSPTPIDRADLLHHMELAAKAMDALPDNSGLIARHFMKQGMQAVCGNPSQCALAQHLNTEAPLPAGYFWTVSGVGYSAIMSAGAGFSDAEKQEWWRVVSSDDDYLAGERHNFAALSPAQVQFVCGFDRHEYPSLVKE